MPPRKRATPVLKTETWVNPDLVQHINHIMSDAEWMGGEIHYRNSGLEALILRGDGVMLKIREDGRMSVSIHHEWVNVPCLAGDSDG